MRSVKHRRAAIIFCLTSLCRQLSSFRRSFKKPTNDAARPITRSSGSAPVWFSRMGIFIFPMGRVRSLPLKFMCIFSLKSLKDLYFNHNISKSSPSFLFLFLILNKNCVGPGCFSATCVATKLLLMKKIGFIFLFKWICHFLSEGKMMIQED